MSVRSFLTSLKGLVESGSLLKSPLKFVTGNQSADLDSVISAISYSYFTNLKDSSNHVIPLINIPRSDLKLRRDIELVLKAHSITEDLLYFVEDFSKLILQTKEVPSLVTLVDHCSLQGDELIGAFKEKKIDVVSIIDHHADEGFAVNASPRIIQTNGSCSSLVFNFWVKQMGEPLSFYEKTDVISLLLAPLLIDTTNMTAKVEADDTLAFKAYSEILNSPNNAAKQGLVQFISTDDTNSVSASESESTIFEDFYKLVKSEKKNIKGFTFKDFLRKDYKQFVFVNAKTGVQSKIGFSSLLKPFSWILKNFSEEEVLEAIVELSKDYELDVEVMTPSYTRKDNDEYAREFTFSYNASNKSAELYSRLPELVNSALDLHSDDLYKISPNDLRALNSKGQVVKIFNQHNLAASRKQVVPAVKEAIEES